MKLRRFIRILHRDIGYVVFTLTIIYAISGIAVNHINDWNPNYIIIKDTLLIPSSIDSIMTSEILQRKLKTLHSISDSTKSYFRSSPYSIDIFFEGKSISANLRNNKSILETIESRSFIRESNFLHLNNPKKIWTWVADLFAFCLIFLAITGLFMNKGKNGFMGRGKWLLLIGTGIPILFLIIYF